MRAAFLCSMLVAAALAGCSGSVEAPSPNTSPDQVVRVPVTTIALTAVDEIYEATGSIKAITEVTLSAKVAGDVVALTVSEGDAVRAGQLLVGIDDRDLTSRTRRANAGVLEAQSALQEVVHGIRAAEAAKTAADTNLRLATSTLERYNTLRERRAVSAQEFDQVESRQQAAAAEVDRAAAALDAAQAKRAQILARIEQAQAEVETSSIGLGYTQVRSPITGVVRKKFVEAGAQAGPGSPLLTIEGRDYEIEAAIPESHAPSVRVGARVEVSFPSLGVESVQTRVTTIVPDVDPATRTYQVKLALPRLPAAARLQSGMFVRVRVPVGKREIITVPAAAIVERGRLQGVFVVDDENVVRWRLITTDHRQGQTIGVLSGLVPGDRAIFDQVALLKDGAKWRQ